MDEPRLYIVPTPIGNLKDITLRALEVLRSVDTILAEDTRVTLKLLSHYQITGKRLEPFHKYNEHRRLEQIVERLGAGETMALVTDAGMPGISDPGFLLVRACIERQIEFDVLPGATALITALVASGLPSDRFVFEGFLPHKKGRRKRLEQLAQEQRTMIFYESPHRLVKTLEQFVQYFGPDRKAAVARELTKLHQQILRDNLAQLLKYYSQNPPKGEIVIVVQGREA